MPDPKSLAQLIVEGKDDQHVVWALCEKYRVAETFSVEYIGDDSGGIDPLLRSIPVRLKVSGLRALGIMLDADLSLSSRFRSVCQRLVQSGFRDLPEQPETTGTILHQPPLPRVGIWLMPNNVTHGMLEDFVAHLIPHDDPLKLKAESILDQIESEKIQRYAATHRSKAYIHTWLSWQQRPGQPMGQAITAATLQHNAELSRMFMAWLQDLFNPQT